MDITKSLVLDVPFLDISAPAGLPSPAADYIEDRINLNDFLIRHPLSTFIVRCTGDSMINAFIPPACYLVVDRSLNANNGDIVLAYLNGEFTVKMLRKNDFKCWLIPANKKYREIEVTPEMNMMIWGVVTSVISNPKELRNVCVG
jgi:DNA polymerase V